MADEATNMKDKVCIVTGANSGVGKATALGLAKMGATLVMMCRNQKTGEEALAEITRASGNGNVSLLHLDLGSQASIRQGAEDFLQSHSRLDLLINNAATIHRKRVETSDGFEAQFGVNHLGPFLLTHLLLDLLKKSAPARIVNVASTIHHNAVLNFDDLQSKKTYGPLKAYGQSKLANILFTYELARRLEGTGVTANCLHPGVVNTNIMRDLPGIMKPLLKIAGLFMLNPANGANTSLYAATSPEVDGVSGEYFDKGAIARSSRASHDTATAERLWNLSAEMTGM